MLLSRFANFVLSSRVKGVAIVFLATFFPFPFLSSLGGYIANLITLRKGAFEGSLAFATVIIATLLGVTVFRPPMSSSLVPVLFILNFGSCLLTWAFALILRSYASWSLLLEVSAIIGVGLILCLHWIYPDIFAWWSKQLTAYFSGQSSAFTDVFPSLNNLHHQQMSANMHAFAEEDYKHIVASLARYAMGYLVALGLFGLLVNLLVVRAWELIVFAPGRLRSELHSIRLGMWVVIGSCLIVVFNLMGNQIASDMLPSLILVCSLAGLSFIHVLFFRLNKGWVGLAFLYIGILFFFPLSAFVLASFGVFASVTRRT